MAEVGGTLGLFLGFSFMWLWDGVELVTDVVHKIKRRIAPSVIYIRLIFSVFLNMCKSNYGQNFLLPLFKISLVGDSPPVGVWWGTNLNCSILFIK